MHANLRCSGPFKLGPYVKIWGIFAMRAVCDDRYHMERFRKFIILTSFMVMHEFPFGDL